jgi:hypothetical protein
VNHSGRPGRAATLLRTSFVDAVNAGVEAAAGVDAPII